MGVRCAANRPSRLPHQEHQRHAQHRGYDRHPQQRRDLVVEQFVAGEAEQRAHHRAEGVHRPVEAEHPTAGGIIDVLDKKRVPRGAPNPLAEPVDHAPGQHTGPGRRRRDDDLAERRHAVSGRDQRAPGVAITERARGELRQRRRAFSDTLHRPDDGGRRAQHRGEIDRQQRIQQLAGGVLKERDSRKHPHIAGQPAAHPLHHAVRAPDSAE